jgi:hypothetical protein
MVFRRNILSRTGFSWRLAGPAFVGVIEGGGFPVAEQPCDFRNRQALLQISLGKIRSHPIEHDREGEPLGREPASECARAHTEPTGDFDHTRLSMRQQRRRRSDILATCRIYLRASGQPAHCALQDNQSEAKRPPIDGVRRADRRSNRTPERATAVSAARRDSPDHRD